ncbi:hypothetical protein ACWGK5_25695 [Rhodococcus qingshengii]
MSEIRSQATPARDELERSAIGWQQYISRALGCKPGQLTYQLEECIEKIEGLKPRTVNIATELDALPMFTVIRSEQGSVWERQYGALGKPLWIEATQTRGFPHTSDEITLPATVLFTPGDAG